MVSRAEDTAAAFPVADSVFGLVGEIGVGGAEVGLHFRVGLGARVGVRHQNRDRRAERDSAEDAGEDFAGVRLLARRDDVALAGTAAVEVRLDIDLGKRQARRASVDNDAHAAAVGFAPGGDAEKGSKRAGHVALKKPEAARGITPIIALSKAAART
jgi:hypothetical protein